MAITKNKKPMTDEEILSVLESAVRTSVGYQDSRLSTERQTVMEYYNGDKPHPVHRGNSKYISTDVFDSVESMKAALLETFAAGAGIGEYIPAGPQDVEDARIATAYADDVIFRQNCGYEIFSDVIQDGLMNRIGVAQAWWDEEVEEIEEEFEGAPEESLSVLLMSPDINLKEITFDEVTGLYDGTIIRREDKSQVRIESIPPEDFGINPSARTIEEASCVWRRHRKTRSDLIKEGYSPKLVKKIRSDSELSWLDNPEALTRNEQFAGDRLGLDGEFQEQTETLLVYEVYLEIDPENSGTAQLWKYTYAGDTILHREQVRKKPFLAYVPLRIPHSFHGSNFAAKVIPTQNAKTTLTRGILDHTVVTNNPRYKVIKGSLQNPKELMDSRVGGIVNMNRPDGVVPFEQPMLNPFVFQTIQLLDYDLEDTTGVSRLSQGLNKDAVSKQNSAAMIEQLTNMSQIRQKIIARNFAEGFLKPLYTLVYELIQENESRDKVLSIGGEWLKVNPQIWTQKREFRVDLRLGYGEKEREAQQWLTFHQVASSDPTLAPLYSLDKKFNVMRRVLELQGVKDIENYMVLPEQVPPPEPDPMVLKELEFRERELALREQAQAMAERKLELEYEEKLAKLRLEELKASQKVELDTQRVEIEERRQDLREYVDKAEVELLKSADPENQRHIISPSG